LLDVAPIEGMADPVDEFNKVQAELEKFSRELAELPRWLILNKVDLLPEEERDGYCKGLVERLNWSGPLFTISALQKLGTQPLVYALMEALEGRDE
ncbi:MAG TPA: GTPase ObgE, partial [Gammaproteobacteria bacterium]|nr:GTPase ObgE [Gammaproteobacteria bacterium]